MGKPSEPTGVEKIKRSRKEKNKKKGIEKLFIPTRCKRFRAKDKEKGMKKLKTKNKKDALTTPEQD